MGKTEKPTYTELEEENQRLKTQLSTLRKELQNRQERDSYESRFREVIANIQSGIAIYQAVENGANFKFVDLNPAVETIENINKNEVLGRNVTEVFPAVKEFGLLDVFKRVWKTGKPEDHPVSQYKDERIVSWRDNYVFKLGTGEIVAFYDDATKRKQTEEALENERAFLSAVIDNIEEAIVTCDQKGNIIRFNQAARKLHGLPEQPIPPEQWAGYYHLYRMDGITPLPKDENPLYRALKGEHVIDAEIVVAPKYSNPHSLLCSGQALPDENGNITGAVVAMHDITERKQAEEELRIKNRISSAFINNEGTQFFTEILDILREVLSSEHGYFGYINDAGDIVAKSMTRDVSNKAQVENRSIVFPKDTWEGLWGKSLSEKRTLFHNGKLHLPPDHLQVKSAIAAPVIINNALIGQVVLANKPGGYDNNDKVLINKLCDHIAPLLYSELQEEQYKQNLLEAKEKAEKNEELTRRNLVNIKFLTDCALHFVENRYEDDIYAFIAKKLNELNPETYILINEVEHDNRITETKAFEGGDSSLNKFFKDLGIQLVGSRYQFDDRLFGMINGKLHKMPVGIHGLSFESIPESIAAKIENYLNIASIYGISFILDNKIYANAFMFLPKGKSIQNTETVEAFVKQASMALKRRESENELVKAKERAEESDRLKSAFLANMSHEIRTPMNSILGFTQLLQTKDYPWDKQRKFLELIHSRGTQLLQIINDIVDISKIEANQFQLEYQHEYLNDIMQELYNMYLNELKNKGKDHINLEVKTGLKRKNSYIYTDPNRLRQIIDNLLSNAIKHTNEGAITYGYELQTKDTLLFYVRDTGTGIPPDQQNHIFERFRQAGTSSGNNEGTGLGLTISKNLTELLGGTIWLESSEGEGTVFYFTLPYETKKAENTEKMNKETQTIPEGKGKTLLIIEDDPASLEYLKEILEPENFNLITCIEGEEGVKQFTENPEIDLVLLDLKLPDIDGLDVLKKIRSSEVNNKVPIIAQTAYAMSGDAKKAINAGCDDYISKPIDIEELQEKITKFISA